MTVSPARVALVSGGTRGIGLAIARGLLEGGVRVAFSARTRTDVDRVARELAGLGKGAVLGITGDVADEAACQRMVEATIDAFGSLDILVNNAGVGIFHPIHEMPLEDWRAQIDTNLTGTFLLSRAAVPHLKASGDGWIINIGSLAGRNAFAGGGAYNASKFGLLGLSEAMMLDLRYEGIRVSLVMPGSVDTSFGDRPEGEKEGWALTSEDVSRAVLDLLRYPLNAHVSRVEMRPSQPLRKK